MNDIIRKQMKDVIVSHNDVIRRPVTIPETYRAPSQKEEEDRIEKNPFFEKGKRKEREPLKTQGQDKGGRSRALLWALLVVLLLSGGFAVASYFSSATVEIVPISRSVNLDNDFTAVAFKGAVAGDLVFHFATSTEEKVMEIPATEEKKIQRKASGKVVIFNAYNAGSQRLIKNTRLESTDHKIFRIDESVVVPGAKMIGGKVSVPGSVEALVYADASGKEYNIGLADFTIPGFKGDPRYTKFTAKSKADSLIAGGFSGTVKVPTDEAVLAAQTELKNDLTKIAVEKIRANIPDGMSLFPGSLIVKPEEVPQEFTMTDTTKVSMRATVSVFFFDTTLLTAKLAEALPPEDKGKTFTVSDMSMFTFLFVDPSPIAMNNVVFSDLTKIKFNISGDAKFIGQVDSSKIRMALVGKDKKDFGAMITEQNNIYKADAVISPVWKTMFPLDPTKITVKIVAK